MYRDIINIFDQILLNFALKTFPSNGKNERPAIRVSVELRNVRYLKFSSRFWGEKFCVYVVEGAKREENE